MTNILITEQEVQKLFNEDRPLNAVRSFFSYLLSFYKWVTLFVIFFAMVFLIINAPALYLKVRYSVLQKTKQVTTNFTSNDNIYSPAFFVPEDEITNEKIVNVDMPNDYLQIPKIEVSAPVIWQVEPSQIVNELNNGVVGYKDTALPGQTGNVFITGHSSDYWWKKGAYKQVFVLLDQLKMGDKIYVSNKNKAYEYQVTGSEIVKPDQLDVLSSKPGEKDLTLMTCVPIGTSLNRLVVRAVLSSAVPKGTLEPLNTLVENKPIVNKPLPTPAKIKTTSASVINKTVINKTFLTLEQKIRESTVINYFNLASICYLNPIYPKRIATIDLYVPDVRLYVRPLTYLPNL